VHKRATNKKRKELLARTAYLVPILITPTSRAGVVILFYFSFWRRPVKFCNGRNGV
jgi:hypothetical protein